MASPLSMSPTPTLVNEGHDTASHDKSLTGKTSSKSDETSGSVGTRGMAPQSPQTNSKSLGRSPTDLELSMEGYEGLGTTESPFVVKWLEGERESPLKWSRPFKYLLVAGVAIATLCVAFASSIYAGAIAPMEEYFEVSTEVITLGLSTYLVGLAIGPLVWAGGSELYGRRIVFIVTYFPFFAFHFGCAFAHNIETLVICRFFSGFFGSSTLTNAGGTISDIFPASERALGLALFALAPFAGPVLGPIVGGFVGQLIDWRWVFYILIIFSGVMYALCFWIPETYTPVLLRWKARDLSKQSGKFYVSEYDLKSANETLVQKLRINIFRPFTLLIKEPIVLLFAIYAAFIYGVLYLLFGAFPIVFQEERGWKSGPGGLPFIGVGLGMLIGIAINTFYVNPKYVRDLHAAGGTLPPEARLPIMAFGGCCLPVGLFWFAWTTQPSVHWIVPCLASVPFGLGMVTVFLSCMSYLVDSYLIYAASALGANALLRGIFGAVFPLFTVQMFHGMGTNKALTLIACVAALMTPIPFLFIRYGAQIRRRSTYAQGHRPVALSKVATCSEKEQVAEVADADLRLREVEEAEQAKEAEERALKPTELH